MATWPWARSWQNQGIELDKFPAVKRWFETIAERPAVKRAITVLADRRKPLVDQKARETLFGATQYAKR
jgi:GST-like protein